MMIRKGDFIMSSQELFKELPSVNELIEKVQQNLSKDYSYKLLLESCREYIEDLRMQIKSGRGSLPIEDEMLAGVRSKAESKDALSLRRVINATGVVLHTNLGRALMSNKAQEAISEIIKGYCNLEVSLETGKRGIRYSHVDKLLEQITGAEAALVVNNNAAAVFLILTSLAKEKEVIVSRGQLVEIGGSFRVPEIMAASGAELVEVGTTNKTKFSDYENAITDRTSMLLKVHTSNYRIVGFTQEVSIAELRLLGDKYTIPVVEDLGSGFLVDLRELGITDEPTVQESIASGADIVCFSGDKLLGGPQAGIIVGKKDYLDIIKEHPLNRALRVDKMTLAALEATLREYLFSEQILSDNPTLKMLAASEGVLKDKAFELAEILKGAIGESVEVNLRPERSRAGGGSLPTTDLPTWVVSCVPKFLSLNTLVKELRMGLPSILVRIADGAVILDVRTIAKQEFTYIKDRMQEVLSKG
jgi:L-seryl-tRNA(Ser) seleniumtransferase